MKPKAVRYNRGLYDSTQARRRRWVVDFHLLCVATGLLMLLMTGCLYGLVQSINWPLW